MAQRRPRLGVVIEEVPTSQAAQGKRDTAGPTGRKRQWTTRLLPVENLQTYQTALTWGVFLVLALAVMAGLIVQAAIVNHPQAHAQNVVNTNTSVSVIPIDTSLSRTVGKAPTVTAQAAFLFNPETGAVYYVKDANQELPQASCTKIMTALIAVEHGNLNQIITVGADAHALVNPDSSHMGLDVGEKLTLRDLLYGLMLPSGNDAAVAIADGIGGSVPKFVAMMNQEAQKLGLTRTHFVTPHGLDAPGHYTTARDLALLAAYAMRNSIIRQITSTYSYDIPKTADHKAYHLVTGNDLLPFARAPYPGAIGVKPGFTGNAGYCMAFAAVRRGHLLVGAVLNDPSWEVRITDMRALLDWGYTQFGYPTAPHPTPGSNPSPNE
ncbi:MAG TPA: D-alanyl-D-alanine carboxypeptidase family protein [Ktedonobacterales bacterium]|nr:D-alanyl-D-alanine carboxypeptidase family protein [Ktedonobacterales bacterium]